MTVVHVEALADVDDVLVVHLQQPVSVRGEVEIACDGEIWCESGQPYR